MKTIQLEAAARKRAGKGPARSARREGLIPGVIYGHGEPVAVAVERKSFVQAMQDAQGENIIFDFKLDGGSAEKAIARELQHDPISHSVIHVDFQRILMTEKINVEIAIHLVGEPEGVKNFGGILEHVAREVEVECLPADIPSHFDVDVSALMIGDSIHISDLPAGSYEVLDDPTQVVAHVAAPTVEKVAAEEEEGAEGVEGEAPKEGAEGEKKDDESKGDGGKDS